MTGPLPWPRSYATKWNPVCSTYVRTREHDSRSPRRNCAPLTLYFGARVGAGSDPRFSVENCPVVECLSHSPPAPGVAPVVAMGDQ